MKLWGLAASFQRLSFPHRPWFPRTAAALALLSASAAHAAIFTWTGSGGNSWSTSTTSWNNGSPSMWVNDSPADTAVFGAAPATLTVDPGIQVAAINFNAPGWVIGNVVNNGSITMDSSGGTIAVSTIGSNTINSQVSNNGGIVGMSIGGGGTLMLGGTNTNTGGISVSAGTNLSISASANLGGNNNILTLDGGTLIANNSSLTLASATNIHPINLTANGGTFSVASGTFTVNTVISGNGGLAKSGAGTLSLGNTDTFLGGLTLNAGAVSVASNQTFTGGIDLAGPATLVVTNNFTLAAQPLVMSGGAVSVSSTSRAASTTFNGTTLHAGSSQVAEALMMSNSFSLALGALSRDAGATLDFNTLPSTGSITTTTANSSGGILGGYAYVFTGTTNVYSWATSAGTGSAAGSIGKLTTFTATIAAGGNVDMPSGAQNDSGGSGAINSLRFNSTIAAAITLANPLSIASGGILLSNIGTANESITGATLTSGNGQDLIIINANNAGANTFTIGSKITGGVGLTFTTVNSFAAKVALTADNDFTGDTNINSGTLELDNSFALRNSTLNARPASAVTGITGGGSGVAAPAITFGSGITAATFGGLKGSANLNLNNLAATPLAVDLTVGGNNQSTVYSGILSNNQAGTNARLTKTGSGSLTLSGANTYSGITGVTAGTLIANNNKAVSAGVSVSASAALQIDNDIDLTPNIGPLDVTLLDPTSAMIIGTTGNIGTAAMTGDLTATGGGTLNADINGNTPADLLAIAGNVNAGGTWTINLNDLAGSSAQVGIPYIILTATNLGAAPTTLIGTINSPSFMLDPNYHGGGIFWNSAANAVSIQLAPIPEPTTLALLGLGVAALLTRRRR